MMQDGVSTPRSGRGGSATAACTLAVSQWEPDVFRFLEQALSP
jgi:hypothetical protein